MLRDLPRYALLAATAAASIAAAAARAQPAPLDRLPSEILDAMPPSARVSGEPGRITVTDGSCHSVPRERVRRRIVDLAIQEWGYFGFTVVDEASPDFERLRRERRERRRESGHRRWVDPQESARVVDSIAGFWAVTPDGGWIIERQNRIWRAANGVVERWRDPWSAAFISWVMCEGGLADNAEFRRAIAHYVYIDQAIEARDRDAAEAAFVAYEVGEAAVEPGDLLCRARRGAYRTLAERRADLGDGARSHCDIVVKLDPAHGRILAIGGNVRGSVRLKFLPAAEQPGRDGPGRYESIGRGSRVVFAHLKLRAPAIGNDALETSPTIKALSADREALRALERRLAAAGTADGGLARSEPVDEPAGAGAAPAG